MAAPRVEFQCVELHQFQQAGRVTHHQVMRVHPAFFLELYCVDQLQPGRMVFLEEAGLCGATGASDDRERAVNHLGKQVLHHCRVVIPHVLLGVTVAGEQDLARRGQRWRRAIRHRCQPGLARRSRGCRCARRQGRSSAIGIGEVGDILVRAHRLQRRLAQQLLPADAAVEDLHHESRLEPGRSAQVGVLGGHVRGWFAAATALDALADLADQLVREPGPHPAGVKPAVLRIRPGQQQRAEAGTAAFGCGVAHHRKLVAGKLFGLAPVITAAAVVAAVGALGNDAFEMLLTGQAIGLVAIALHMGTERQRAALPFQQGLQQGLAFQ